MPKTPRGFESILVIADRCTDWIEAKPVKSMSAAETAAAVMELIIYRHEESIVSDNGGAFVSQLLR